MTSDDVEDRLARLRAEWPAGSIVGNVMARIGTPADRVEHRTLRRRQLAAALAASALLVCGALMWLLLPGGPRTLQAAVEDGLAAAHTAHLVFTDLDEKGQPERGEVWYRRGEGYRSESGAEVRVEDGKFQWVWQPPGVDEELVVIRQPVQSFFAGQIARMLALPDIPFVKSRIRVPGLDRAMGGQPCLAYIIAERDPELPPGSFVSDPHRDRRIVLADGTQRIHQITHQRLTEGSWQILSETRIDYDVEVPPERIAARLPRGARVIEPELAFEERHPVERALFSVDLGGLLLAVHDLRPLEHGEGYYVVSSVRGTPEFLKKYPPKVHPFNPDIPLLDVAQQPRSPRTLDKYHQIGLAFAQRQGVEFTWWLILPRRTVQVKDGKRVEVKTQLLRDPLRLDNVPGTVQLPLEAYYWDKQHRDARGVLGKVFQWVAVPLPADRRPTTLEDVAGRTRRDLLLMRHGSLCDMYGYAAGGAVGPPLERPLDHFEPDKVTDTEYAAAIRRLVEEFQELDSVDDPGPPGDAAPR